MVKCQHRLESIFSCPFKCCHCVLKGCGQTVPGDLKSRKWIPGVIYKRVQTLEIQIKQKEHPSFFCRHIFRDYKNRIHTHFFKRKILNSLPIFHGKVCWVKIIAMRENTILYQKGPVTHRSLNDYHL